MPKLDEVQNEGCSAQTFQEIPAKQEDKEVRPKRRIIKPKWKEAEVKDGEKEEIKPKRRIAKPKLKETVKEQQGEKEETVAKRRVVKPKLKESENGAKANQVQANLGGLDNKLKRSMPWITNLEKDSLNTERKKSGDGSDDEKTMQSDKLSNEHLINCLQEYQKIWTIKAVVTQRYGIKKYKTSKGEGKIQKVILKDAEGTYIQAILFNEAVEEHSETLNMGKTYLISNGNIKQIDKRFPSVHDKLELILNVGTIITEAESDPIIEKTKYNFSTPDMIEHASEFEYKDLCLAVMDVGDLKKIKRKADGTEIKKREITVIGLRTASILLTLWEDLAINEGEKLKEISDKVPIIAITSIKRSDFNGFSLSSTTATTLEIEPDVLEAREMREWILQGNISEDISSKLSKSMERPINIEEVTLRDVINDVRGSMCEATYRYCKVMIIDVNDSREPWYTGCKSCNTKVFFDANNEAKCSKCNKNNIDYCKRYVCKIRIKDAADEAWLTLFDNEAKEIIGCPAEELAKLREEDGGDEKFKKVLRKCIGREYTFRIKAKEETYRNQTTIALTACNILKEEENATTMNAKFKEAKEEKEENATLDFKFKKVKEEKV